MSAPGPRLLVHGGAGGPPAVPEPERAAFESAAREALAAALCAGQRLLADGGSALDAVCAAAQLLEDAPCFNAGRGAVFNHEGRVELDAAVMAGDSLRAGAVAGVRHIRNPVLLARQVMEQSSHVLLIQEGAEAFARHIGMALVNPSYFHTDLRWRELQETLRREREGEAIIPTRHGTVGAVALDAEGRLAVATSTGGLTNKRWGRVGDSPLIGAGTYANRHCAVSGTGWGEYYIRAVAAHEICSRVARGEAAEAAGAAVIHELISALGGEGGALVLAADGRFATPFSTERMYRGWVEVGGEPQVAITAEEGDPALRPRPTPRE